MANRRKKIKAKSISAGKMAFKVGKVVAGPIAFLKQISEKDRQDLGEAFDNASLTTKAKQMTNIVLGRVTGFNPFNDVAKAPQTINPGGIINSTTNAGLIMLGYGFLGSKLNKVAGMSLAPATREFKSLGKSVTVGGGVGGFFDPPMGSQATKTSLAGQKLSRVENGQSVPQTTIRQMTSVSSNRMRDGASFV